MENRRRSMRLESLTTDPFDQFQKDKLPSPSTKQKLGPIQQESEPDHDSNQNGTTESIKTSHFYRQISRNSVSPIHSKQLQTQLSRNGSALNGIAAKQAKGNKMHNTTNRGNRNGDIAPVVEGNTNDDTESDNDEDVALKLSDLPWGQRWLAFVDTVSVVGLKYAVDPRASNVHRVVWGALVLVGIGFMIYQIYERCSYFLTYPATTHVIYSMESKLRFPTVTICNENLVAESRSAEGGFGDLILNIYPPYPDPTFTPNFTIWEPLFNDLKAANYEWKEAWYYFSHLYNLNEWIIFCTFNGESCTDGMFHVVLTTMGYCLQFNANENYKTSVPGSYFGLSLVMDALQDEYLYAKSRGAGFRVLLHSPDRYPDVDFAGMRISVGEQTSLATSLSNLTLLSSPYGDCKANEGYHQSTCILKCSFRYVARRCGCQLWYSELDDIRSCDPKEMYECADPAFNYFQSNYISKDFDESCDCPPNCLEMNYGALISSNKISDFTAKTIVENLIQEETCTNASDPTTCQIEPDLNTTIAYLHNNIVDVEIYMESLSFEDIQERPSYTILALLCDIGGAMGLILGSTILTVAEIGEFLTFLIYDVILFKITIMHMNRKRDKKEKPKV